MDNHKVKKAIDDARYIYEDYFQTKKTIDLFNNIPGVDVEIIPKFSHSTCSRCLNSFDHNESNYSTEYGFVCDNCSNETPSFL